MKALITTFIISLGFLFINPTTSIAQDIQRIEIVNPPANFSKAMFKAALKKAGIDKEINITPLVKSLEKKNGNWSFGASQSAIKTINNSKQFTIKNNMMTGMIGNSPI